jgi:hypothetical protein
LEEQGCCKAEEGVPSDATGRSHVGLFTPPPASLADARAVVDHQLGISQGLELVQGISRHDQDVGDPAGLEGSNLVS